MVGPVLKEPPPAVDVSQLVDASPLGLYRVVILVVLGLTVLIDGIDVQAMGYVAPAIISDWGIDRAALGPVFGAGMTGMLVGSLVLSLAADRFGRRPVVLGATLWFALCMLLTTRVSTLGQLLQIRFVTGLGLGAIMPNGVALAGELSPRRNRNTLMMLVSCGFTVGAVIGGLLAAAIIPLWGWRSVFYVGGIFPLLLAALMYRFVPESLQFRVLKRRDLDAVRADLRRIAPGARLDQEARLIISDRELPGVPVAELFRHGRAAMTLLLWLIFLFNLVILYFLSNWLPTIATGMGLSTSSAVLVGTALQVGGVAGTLLMGPLIDRRGFIVVLLPIFIVATLSIALIGRPGLSFAALCSAVIVTGFCIVGTAPALVALAADSYPMPLRATGMGWCLGVARIGSILGPVLGGALIGLHWTNSELFSALALPAIGCALLLFVLGRLPGRQTG